MLVTIYPDTNVFYKDRFLRRQYSKDFLAILAPGVIEVGVPPVVLAETQRHANEEADKTTRALSKAIRTIAHSTEADTAAVEKKVAALNAKVLSEARAALSDLLSNPATSVLEWGDVSAEELVERELERRRPTLLKDEASVGLRDTVIWHTILDDIDPESDGLSIFVTNDGGFLDSRGTALHKDLLKDLRDRGIEPDRVRVQRDLAGATVEAQRIAQLIGEREAVLRAEFVDYMRQLDRLDWGMSHDTRHGGWRESETYPATLPSYLEQVMGA